MSDSHRKQVTITVVEAKGLLKNPEKQTNPYCLVTCGNVRYRTNTQHATLKPEWKQKFSFNDKEIQDVDAQLTVCIWSLDKYSSDAFLGQVSIPLSGLTPNNTTKQWYPLQPGEPPYDDKVKGKILLEITLVAEQGSAKKKSGVEILKRKLSIGGGDMKSIEKAQIQEGPEATSEDPQDSVKKQSPKHRIGKDTTDESGVETSTLEPRSSVDKQAPLDKSESEITENEVAVSSDQRDKPTKTVDGDEGKGDSQSAGPTIKRAKSAKTVGEKRKRRKVRESDSTDNKNTPAPSQEQPEPLKKHKSVKNLTVSDTSSQHESTTQESSIESRKDDRLSKKQSTFFKVFKLLGINRSKDKDKDSSAKKAPDDLDVETRLRSNTASPTAIPDSECDDDSIHGRPRAVSAVGLADIDVPRRRKKKRAKPADSSDESENRLARKFSEMAVKHPANDMPSTNEEQASPKPTLPNENTAKLLAIDRSLEFTGYNQFSLHVDPSRVFIKEGAFKLVDDRSFMETNPTSAPSTSTNSTDADAATAKSTNGDGSSQPQSSEATNNAAPEAVPEATKIRLVDVYGFLLSDMLLICKRFGEGENVCNVPLFRLSLENTFVVDPMQPLFSKGEITQSLGVDAKITLELVEVGVSVKRIVFANKQEKMSWLQAITNALSKCKLTYSENEKPFLYKLLQQHKEIENQLTDIKWGRSKSLQSFQRQRVLSPAAVLAASTPPSAELKQLREELAEANKKREKLAKDLEEANKLLEARERTIADLTMTIDEMKAELKVVRRKDPPPVPNATGIEAQLEREISQREAYEKKAMEYMNRFLELTKHIDNKKQQELDIANRLSSLEKELERLRLAIQTPTTSTLKQPASLGIDFEKERKAFEELFARGRRELLEIINNGPQMIMTPRGTDSGAVTDSELHDSEISANRRRKGAQNRKRRSDTSGRDQKLLSASGNGGDSAMKLELEQLRRAKRTLEKNFQEMAIKGKTAKHIRGYSEMTTPKALDDSSSSASAHSPNPSPESASDQVSRPSNSASSISASTSSSPLTTVSDTNSVESGGSVSSQTTQSSPASSIGKEKRLKAVRFISDTSGDESSGRGSNWKQHVAQKLGLKKKKEVPSSVQPWRKQPAVPTDGAPLTVKSPNRLDLSGLRSEYWSDPDSAGVLSGTEGGFGSDYRAGHADNSDYSTDTDCPAPKLAPIGDN